ncbi:MAG: pirin family protein [Proteobacteria bacterium]|nr:pirin family protein [Pseudomonadota bacterium]
MNDISTTETRKLRKLITGMPATDGAGVKLTRVIGQPALQELDPFLLLDAFRSDDPDDYIAGFPSHPHRGFETVTYLLEGRMRHKDNAGNEGVIEAGGIQWMTAGRGIIHSEMPEQEDGRLEGFQLWVNLPASHKMTEPAYQEHNASNIPVESRPGTKIRVIAGETSLGTAGPILQPLTEPLYLDVSLDANTAFSEKIAKHHNAFVYVIEGSVTLESDQGGTVSVVRDQLAILTQGATIELESTEQAARFLLIGGKPLGEPIVRSGPFVMNTREELQQAYSDYQSGNF